MDNEEQFLSAIELIADKLGIAASEIFDIFVNAQVMLGVLAIIECVTIILLSIISYFAITKIMYGFYTYNAVMKSYDKSDEYYDSDDKNAVIVTPMLITVVLMCVWMLCVNTIKYGIIRIMCPEYSAIVDIIELVI